MTSTGATPPTAFTPPLAERIGPYRILQLLGEGGMGVVYEAEETEPVRRRVALKVVRDRHAPRDVLARFEVERQALAVMNHPGIAKVYGAGTTEQGQPYFAMELVRGLPITQYCDEQRLPVRQRLELFVAVCHAVQHAHQKGLIHRDLKPSNILVTDVDGAPEPKIIDFGIAKALGQQLTDLTLVTQFGHAIGTAAYMSPEQAESSGIDIDTRSDIYSLGVLLYEILVGVLPVDPTDVGIHAYLVRLLARDAEPLTPSVRIDKRRTNLTAVAHARRTDIARLRRDLSGDLDCIVMKAMEADRARRYATANGLAMDIQRYLASEPIAARPPSTVYRIGKFVRRKKAFTTAVAVAGLAVLAGTAFTTFGMVRATRAEARADAEARLAREAAAFMGDLFRPVPMPGLGPGLVVTARDVLDRGVVRARGLRGRLVLQGLLLHELGVAYAQLGDYEAARGVLDAALDARGRTPGLADSVLASTLDEIGNVLWRQGDYPASDVALSRALALRQRADPGSARALAPTLSAIAQLRTRETRFAEAESLFTIVIGVHEADPAPDVRRYTRDLTGLATVRIGQKRLREAEPLMQRALNLQEAALGPEHVDVAGTLNNLGVLYYNLHQYDRALTLYERTRYILTRSLPERHPLLAFSYNNIAEAYWRLGRLAEADSLFRESLEIKEEVLGPGHTSVATTLNGLAGVLRDRRQFGEAEVLYRRALAIRQQAFGPSNTELLETRRDYAALLRATGRAEEAAAMTPR